MMSNGLDIYFHSQVVGNIITHSRCNNITDQRVIVEN